MTTVPINHARVCRYCDHGSGIIWHEEDAMRIHDGTWKYHTCINRDTRKMMLRALGPDNPRCKEFIAEEQKTVDQWNNYAKSMNDLNKRMGGTRDILNLKKNPYQQ
jgi:hypothetical protein